MLHNHGVNHRKHLPRAHHLYYIDDTRDDAEFLGNQKFPKLHPGPLTATITKIRQRLRLQKQTHAQKICAGQANGGHELTTVMNFKQRFVHLSIQPQRK